MNKGQIFWEGHKNLVQSRECMGAAGAQTRRSLRHHLLHPRILRPRAPFCRTDCTHRSKFLIHALSFLFESETWKIFSYLLKTMEDFFFLLSTACFSRLNLISNGFNLSLLFFFWAVELAKFAFLLDFTIFTKYFTKNWRNSHVFVLKTKSADQ